MNRKPQNVDKLGTDPFSFYSDPSDSEYSYVANSPLVDHIAFARGGASVMTNQNTYDDLNRLTGKSSSLDFDYQYNAASQRTKVTLMDGSYWLYGYDALGQLTSADKHFLDGTPCAGQQFNYGFDTIGNRTGDRLAGTRPGRICVRPLTRTTCSTKSSPGSAGLCGRDGADVSTNTVKVNGTNAYQKWEYFREQLGTNNGSAPQWVGVSVTAPGQTQVSGGVYLAQNPETITYDLDGNQMSDGRFNYTWDAESRLIRATSPTNAPVASMYSLAFTYDYMGRRIHCHFSRTDPSYCPESHAC